MHRYARSTVRVFAYAPILLAGLLIVLALSPIPASAVSPEQRKQSENLVREALHGEIYGLSDGREQLLDEALRLAPDSDSARWQSGYVRFHRQWMPASEAVEQSQTDRLLIEYQHVREKYPDTIEGQANLARWCQRNGLAEQARAHWSHVLDYDPDHAEARERLGFRRVAGNWTTVAELQAEQERDQKRAKDLHAWTPRLKELRSFFDPPHGPAQREAALARLKAVRDEHAIPALEAVFGGHRADTSLALLDVFEAMHCDEAALAMTRLAVLSPFDSVRDAAARRLRGQPADVYVPALLVAMSTPAQSRTEIYRTSGDRLVYRHAILREGPDTQDLSVWETDLRRVGVPNGDRAETLNRMRAATLETAISREAELATQNARTEQLNARICTTLSISQTQNLALTPETWWQWWNDQNEVSYGDPKPLRTSVNVSQVSFRDQFTEMPSLSDVPGVRVASAGPRSGFECLRAGTPVWTLIGPTAIEKIKVGDLVLSQDIETGELAYKPVLRTTTRPPAVVVRLHVGRETIETSGGHLFWISGDGWTKARVLKSGAILHALAGGVSVSEVEEGDVAPTYNLIVADFSTYFIGAEEILCHDNTPKRATRAVVPGLVER